MAKRFVDTSRHRQAWRKLDPKLRAAFYWLQENCDAAGYWTIDLEHFKFECGYALDVDRLIKETGAVEKHGTDALRMVDFIEVNYGGLREKYNPHKPALRALALRQNSSLNQASTKLEDEEEGEDEDKSRGVERAKPIAERIADFSAEAQRVNAQTKTLSDPELFKFIAHWTQAGQNDKKFHAEKQQTFGMAGRLVGWAGNVKPIRPVQADNATRRDLKTTW